MPYLAGFSFLWGPIKKIVLFFNFVYNDVPSNGTAYLSC